MGLLTDGHGLRLSGGALATDSPQCVARCCGGCWYPAIICDCQASEYNGPDYFWPCDRVWDYLTFALPIESGYCFSLDVDNPVTRIPDGGVEIPDGPVIYHDSCDGEDNPCCGDCAGVDCLACTSSALLEIPEITDLCCPPIEQSDENCCTLSAFSVVMDRDCGSGDSPSYAFNDSATSNFTCDMVGYVDGEVYVVASLQCTSCHGVTYWVLRIELTLLPGSGLPIVQYIGWKLAGSGCSFPGDYIMYRGTAAPIAEPCVLDLASCEYIHDQSFLAEAFTATIS